MASHPATDERLQRLSRKVTEAGDPGGRLEMADIGLHRANQNRIISLTAFSQNRI